MVYYYDGVYSSLASGGSLILSRFSYICAVRVTNAFFEVGECPSCLIIGLCFLNSCHTASPGAFLCGSLSDRDIERESRAKQVF